MDGYFRSTQKNIWNEVINLLRSSRIGQILRLYYRYTTRDTHHNPRTAIKSVCARTNHANPQLGWNPPQHHIRRITLKVCEMLAEVAAPFAPINIWIASSGGGKNCIVLCVAVWPKGNKSYFCLCMRLDTAATGGGADRVDRFVCSVA